MSIEIKTKITGIPAAEELAKSVPDEIVDPTIPELLKTILDQGIIIMKMSIAETAITEKSTGELEASIVGGMEQTGPKSWTVEIGSPLLESFYASQNISRSRIFRNVFINPPGRWRFIGDRPPMPGHPFLETTEQFVMKAVPTLLDDKVSMQIKIVRDRVESLQRSEIAP